MSRRPRPYGLVRGEVEEADVAHAAPRERGDVVEGTLERVGTLDPEERAHHAFRLALLDLGCRAHEAERARLVRHLAVERIDLLVDGARHPARPIRKRERDQPEELRAHASLAHAGEVDVTAERRERERRLVCLVDVVADPARPHQRVGVQIDRGVLGVDRACGVRGERHGTHRASVPALAPTRRARLHRLRARAPALRANVPIAPKRHGIGGDPDPPTPARPSPVTGATPSFD